MPYFPNCCSTTPPLHPPPLFQPNRSPYSYITGIHRPLLSLPILTLLRVKTEGKPLHFGRPYRYSVSRCLSRAVRCKASPLLIYSLSSHIASSGVGTIKFSIWSNWNIPSSAAAFIATITAVTSILSIATRFFDSAVHRGCSQPKIHHPEGVLFLLVDRVGRFAVVRRHPPILNPHRHRTSTPRC